MSASAVTSLRLDTARPKADRKGQAPGGPQLAPSIVHEILGATGIPLEQAVRRDMEARFGHDFSRVRVHADARAAESARTVAAHAYAVRQDVVFDRGRYSPGTGDGRALLAHELAHVVQQEGVGPAPSELAVSPHDAPGEREAERAERPASVLGRTAASGPVLARQPSGPAPAGAGGLSKGMLEQIARALREAMAGLGTDESAIYAAFSGRTQEQVDAIARTYSALFGRSLADDLQDELSESELLELGALAPQHPAGAPAATAPAVLQDFAETVAQQLDRAMRGWGTDESAIYAALTGRTETERRAIKAAYKARTNRELEADLRDELSGAELTRAIRLLNQGLLEPEDELFLAMEGLGTDEDTIFRVLESLAGNATAIEAMDASYRSKYGELVAELRSELSGGDYARAMRVLRPVIQDVAFDDCSTTVIPEVRAAIPVALAKVQRAIAVLRQGWARMSAAEQTVFNRYFDPSGAGFDELFVRDVLYNFTQIRREFDNDVTVECVTAGAPECIGNIYYTYPYPASVYVCLPDFTNETDTVRKQRDFVHELAHNALWALDRPYYESQPAAYRRMTPRGSWTTQIPFVGHIFRALNVSDTLNAPDAYAYFAFDV